MPCFEPGRDVTARLSASLESLPLFPLSGMVLLPGSIVPLHIFEERYVALVTDCLRWTGIFALAQPVPGSHIPYEARPPVLPHLGVVEIVSSERGAQGTYDIFVRCVARANLVEEHAETKAYRDVAAKEIHDLVQSPELAEASRVALLSLCEEVTSRIGESGPVLRGILRRESSPGRLADIAGSALVREVAKRLELLGEADVIRRLDLVCVEVGRVLSELGHPTSHYS